MKKGDILEMFGSEYIVENVYQLSDDEMTKNNLVHRNRITLVKKSGEKGGDRLDFAINNDEIIYKDK
jgi:hypothetical protein